ncbi:MAG: hypothetical protein RL238_2146 [Actinomycetota bacterium]|jgi:hypothetical protein
MQCTACHKAPAAPGLGTTAVALCRRCGAYRYAVLAAASFRQAAADATSAEEAARCRRISWEYEDEARDLERGGSGGYAWMQGAPINEGETPLSLRERLGHLLFGSVRSAAALTLPKASASATDEA